ncbi:CHC2 zinc finger domain-containing protein [uncultured Hyphomicrobium sp.]|uniref:CHC2 zinc finger domain-containing protein n=1 Tax=uncultured Hyphomicrobium sp. TaxID=194373 RepID=UPI003434AB6A
MPKGEIIPFPEVRRVPLTAVLERYGLLADLKRVGISLVGCCPIHKGSNRKQFVVDPTRSMWKCFSPHHDAGGGVLEFVAEYENVTTREAARLVAQWFAIAPIEHRTERRRKMAGERPSHKAFVVEDRGEGEDQGFWTKIGSAWPHKDGKGLNIVLAALPANGRIVLREYTDEDQAEDEKKSAANKGKRK